METNESALITNSSNSPDLDADLIVGAIFILICSLAVVFAILFTVLCIKKVNHQRQQQALTTADLSQQQNGVHETAIVANQKGKFYNLIEL